MAPLPSLKGGVFIFPVMQETVGRLSVKYNGHLIFCKILCIVIKRQLR